MELLRTGALALELGCSTLVDSQTWQLSWILLRWDDEEGDVTCAGRRYSGDAGASQLAK